MCKSDFVWCFPGLKAGKLFTDIKYVMFFHFPLPLSIW